MPHKHKRRHKDESTYDLPPTILASPLPAKELQEEDNKNVTKEGKRKKRRNKWTEKLKPSPDCGLDDDTPRAFRRLMQYREKIAFSSRDNNNIDGRNSGGNKKRKRDDIEDCSGRATSRKKTTAVAADSPTAATAASAPVIPTILPGEKLSDFAARVDQALPLSGIKKSRKPVSSDLARIREGRVTRHEKRLRQLQQQWREEEARIRERETEEREQREAEHEEPLELWKEWEGQVRARAKPKKNPKKKMMKGGESHDGDDGGDDPWAKLNARARATKPRNLSDVAQAPPELTKPREVFKTRGTGGAKVDVVNVPATAGSLRRREELAGERKNVVEEYRRLMAEKRSE